MIEAGRWQGVPGTVGVRVFPIIPPTSILNSNSWLLSAPDALVVIDPGGDPAQTASINRQLRAEMAMHARRTFVVLTHCHLDHSHEAAALDAGGEMIVCAEDSGAQALATGDRERTAAFLWGELAVPRTEIPLRLFADGFRAGGDEVVRLPGGATIAIAGDAVDTGGARPLRTQRLSLGGGEWLEIHHTPGHSACSITPRCGELMFTGDLHFAVNPGLCGLPGWSQPDLVASFGHITHLLRERPSTLCCPGHGNAMPAPTLARILRGLHGEAEQLADIDAIDGRRMRMLTAYTHEFVEEASHLFAVISGRLYALAYHLGALEENAAAQRYIRLLDLDRIDEAISEFRRFRDSFNAVEQPELMLVMRGVETVRRIQRLFAATKLAQVIEWSLLQRADRVLTDLLSSVRGLRFASSAEAVDVNEVVAGIAGRFGAFALPDEALLEAVDDPQRYVEALATRLAVPMALRGVQWDCDLEARMPAADVQRDRLDDILSAVAEDLVGAGARQLRASTAAIDGMASITLATIQATTPAALAPARLALYDRTLRTVGGSLHRLPAAAGRTGVMVRLPLAS